MVFGATGGNAYKGSVALDFYACITHKINNKIFFRLPNSCPTPREVHAEIGVLLFRFMRISDETNTNLFAEDSCNLIH